MLNLHFGVYIFKYCWLNRNEFLTFWAQKFFIYGCFYTQVFFCFSCYSKLHFLGTNNCTTELFLYLLFFAASCSFQLLTMYIISFWWCILFLLCIQTRLCLMCWTIVSRFILLTYLSSITLKCMCLILSLWYDNNLLSTFFKESFLIILISLSNQMTNERVYSRTQRICRHKRMSKKIHTRLRIEFQKQPNTTTTYKRIKKYCLLVR